ncbi:response regulator [Paenibacillus dauci]|uniref:response regulator n=1 Tax=Paenibacillus dauci TaxID=1567106 RepID=UPI000619A3F4|nr:response regulator [Paenibacillus dauci]
MTESQLQVLVVDDEPRQRRGVAALIRQLRPDYKVHEASNGQEALEISLAYPIDLALTDIQMPVMNGMDYIRQVRSSRPDLRIVLITVYDEFQYVQQAIRLSVMDYMIKPVTSEQLLPLLESTERDQQQRQIQLEQQQSLSRQLAKLEPVYQEHLLHRWLTGTLNHEEQQECQHYFQQDTQISIWLMRRIDASRSEESIWKLQLRQHIHAAVAEHVKLYCTGMDDSDDPLIIIVEWPQDWQEHNRQECRNRVMDMLQYWKSVSSMDVHTGESVLFHAADNAAAIHSAYRSAEVVLERHFYDSSDSWLIAASGELDIHPAQLTSFGYPSTALIESAIHKRDQVVVQQELDNLLDQLSADRPSVPLLKYHLLQIIMPCIQQASAGLEQGIRDLYLQRLETVIREAAWLVDLRTHLLGLLSEWIEQLDTCRMSKSDQAMLECRDYLEQHYHEDLSLDEVAGRFYYNPSYFSLLFKSHFGTSFTDYIQRLRMQHARTLLLETNERIAEIGQRAGYRDIKYFAKVFKKTFLYTPEEYRRQFRRSVTTVESVAGGGVSRSGVD